jgi:adenosylhomocysteine nucleosidase
MNKIGILGALPDEVELICKNLDNKKSEDYAGVTYYFGEKNGLKLVVCCAGMGKVNAASTTQVLITKYGVEAVLFSGIAGNMNKQIGIGDVVIANEVIYHDAELRMIKQSAPFTESFFASATLVNAAKKACEQNKVKYVVGRIATGDQFIGDVSIKNIIREKYNPDCVEMEGAATGHVCARNNIPFMVVRAMSDDCEESVETLGAEEFDISDYANKAAAVVLSAIDVLSK